MGRCRFGQGSVGRGVVRADQSAQLASAPPFPSPNNPTHACPSGCARATQPCTARPRPRHAIRRRWDRRLRLASTSSASRGVVKGPAMGRPLLRSRTTYPPRSPTQAAYGTHGAASRTGSSLCRPSTSLAPSRMEEARIRIPRHAHHRLGGGCATRDDRSGRGQSTPAGGAGQHLVWTHPASTAALDAPPLSRGATRPRRRPLMRAVRAYAGTRRRIPAARTSHCISHERERGAACEVEPKRAPLRRSPPSYHAILIVCH